MKKLTIFVDMDDTIEALTDAWLPRINEKYGYHVTPEEMTSWNMEENFPGLTNEEIFSVLDDSIWGETAPVPGAREVLEGWVSEGHRVYIVTATPYETLKAKMDDLLFRWFPFIGWSQVIITSNKQLLKGDVMVDDGLHNLIGGDYLRILVDTPHNRDVDDEKEGLLRVKNWAEIENIVKEAAAE